MQLNYVNYIKELLLPCVPSEELMQQIEKNREFIKGALAGLIAGVTMFIFVETFRWVGITQYGVSYLAGDTVFTFQNNLSMNLIALMVHCGVGVFWGVILSFVFSKILSSDFYLLKVVFFSFCIFFFHLGFLDEPFHYKREIHEQTLDLLIILAGYILYGFIVAIGLKRQGIILK